MTGLDTREQRLEEVVCDALVDVVALVDARGAANWIVSGPLATDPVDTYDVDPADDTGPVVFVRRSDGARFLVDTTVSAVPDPSGRTGLTPAGGWST